MKRFIRTLILATALLLPYGYYTISDGITKWTYLHSWPDTWSLVSVEPA